jgi:acyl carrier protein
MMTDLDQAIASYAVGRYNDGSSLTQAGLESLSVLRLVADVVTDPDLEIDTGHLAHVRTVGDLKGWLRGLIASPAGSLR